MLSSRAKSGHYKCIAPRKAESIKTSESIVAADSESGGRTAASLLKEPESTLPPVLTPHSSPCLTSGHDSEDMEDSHTDAPPILTPHRRNKSLSDGNTTAKKPVSLLQKLLTEQCTDMEESTVDSRGSKRSSSKQSELAMGDGRRLEKKRIQCSAEESEVFTEQHKDIEKSAVASGGSEHSTELTIPDGRCLEKKRIRYSMEGSAVFTEQHKDAYRSAVKASGDPKQSTSKHLETVMADGRGLGKKRMWSGAEQSKKTVSTSDDVSGHEPVSSTSEVIELVIEASFTDSLVHSSCSSETFVAEGLVQPPLASQGNLVTLTKLSSLMKQRDISGHKHGKGGKKSVPGDLEMVRPISGKAAKKTHTPSAEEAALVTQSSSTCSKVVKKMNSHNKLADLQSSEENMFDELNKKAGPDDMMRVQPGSEKDKGKTSVTSLTGKKLLLNTESDQSHRRFTADQKKKPIAPTAIKPVTESKKKTSSASFDRSSLSREKAVKAKPVYASLTLDSLQTKKSAVKVSAPSGKVQGSDSSSVGVGGISSGQESSGSKTQLDAKWVQKPQIPRKVCASGNVQDSASSSVVLGSISSIQESPVSKIQQGVKRAHQPQMSTKVCGSSGKVRGSGSSSAALGNISSGRENSGSKIQLGGKRVHQPQLPTKVSASSGEVRGSGSSSATLGSISSSRERSGSKMQLDSQRARQPQMSTKVCGSSGKVRGSSSSSVGLRGLSCDQDSSGAKIQHDPLGGKRAEHPLTAAKIYASSSEGRGSGSSSVGLQGISSNGGSSGAKIQHYPPDGKQAQQPQMPKKAVVSSSEIQVGHSVSGALGRMSSGGDSSSLKSKSSCKTQLDPRLRKHLNTSGLSGTVYDHRSSAVAAERISSDGDGSGVNNQTLGRRKEVSGLEERHRKMHRRDAEGYQHGVHRQRHQSLRHGTEPISSQQSGTHHGEVTSHHSESAVATTDLEPQKPKTKVLSLLQYKELRKQGVDDPQRSTSESDSNAKDTVPHCLQSSLAEQLLMSYNTRPHAEQSLQISTTRDVLQDPIFDLELPQDLKQSGSDDDDEDVLASLLDIFGSEVVGVDANLSQPVTDPMVRTPEDLPIELGLESLVRCENEIDWNGAVLPEEPAASEIREDTVSDTGAVQSSLKVGDDVDDVYTRTSSKEVDTDKIISQPVCLEETEIEWNWAILPQESVGIEIGEDTVPAACKARDDANDVHSGSSPKEVDVEKIISNPVCFEKNETGWNWAILPEESVCIEIREDSVDEPRCKDRDDLNDVHTGSSPKEVDVKIFNFSEPVCYEEMEWNLMVLPEESAGHEVRKDTVQVGCKARDDANDVHIESRPQEVDGDIFKFSEPVCFEDVVQNLAVLPEESASGEVGKDTVQAGCKARDNANDVHIESRPKEVDADIFKFSVPVCFEDMVLNSVDLPEESASGEIGKDTVNIPDTLQTRCEAGDAILTLSSSKELDAEKIISEPVCLEEKEMEWNWATLPEELLHLESEFAGDDTSGTEVAGVDGADVEPDWSEDYTFEHFGSDFFVNETTVPAALDRQSPVADHSPEPTPSTLLEAVESGSDGPFADIC